MEKRRLKLREKKIGLNTYYQIVELQDHAKGDKVVRYLGDVHKILALIEELETFKPRPQTKKTD